MMDRDEASDLMQLDLAKQGRSSDLHVERHAIAVTAAIGKIPEGDYETIAGFFLEQAQHLPTVGSRVRFGNLRMQVAAMEGSKIVNIHIRRVTELSERTNQSIIEDEPS